MPRIEIIEPRKRLNPSYVQPAIARCHCGAEVCLSDPLNNECEKCHRWYNMVGQEVLNPHSEAGRAAREDDDRFADLEDR